MFEVPRFSRIPLPFLVVLFVACGPGGDGNNLLNPISIMGDEWHVVATIGATRADGAASIGLVTGGAIWEDGSFAALDAGGRRLLVSAPPYSEVTSVEQAGLGPGEFAEPIGMAAWSDTIAIVDRRQRRVSLLVKNGSSARFVAYVPLTFTPEAVCSMSGELIVSGVADGRLLHSVDRNGRILRAFGAPRHEHPLLNEALSAGPLACERETIALAAALLPKVELLDASGLPLLTRALPDFIPIVIRTDGRRAGYAFPEEGKYHEIVSLVGGGNQHFYVSAGLVELGESNGAFANLSHWDIQDSTIVRQPDSPERILAVGKSWMLTGQDLPLPLVRVWQLHPGSSEQSRR